MHSDICSGIAARSIFCVARELILPSVIMLMILCLHVCCEYFVARPWQVTCFIPRSMGLMTKRIHGHVQQDQDPLQWPCGLSYGHTVDRPQVFLWPCPLAYAPADALNA